MPIPEIPKFQVIPGDPFPYGVLCFIQFLPGFTEEDRKQAVGLITENLDRYERSIGGRGLKVVREGWAAPGKYEWIVDPVLKDEPWVRKRMAILATKLRELELEMSGFTRTS
jgi:hypothetical protein